MKTNWTVQKTRSQNEDKLLKLKNVVGVDIGKKTVKGKVTERYCIIV